MLEAVAISDMGCVRTNNEDYCQIAPELGLFVLADGMGGAKAGECASRLAVDTVVELVSAMPERDAEGLIAAVEEANRRVMEASTSDPSLEGMGTTLVAVLETEAALAIASVGDSRAYLFDEEGFRAITDDQTWINEVGRPLGLDEDSLRTHPMRHVLTMAIGAGDALTVNFYSIPVRPGALLLMCSDGLHGVVESSDLQSMLQAGRDGAPLETICQNLIDAAKAGGGPDNVTAVLIRKSA